MTIEIPLIYRYEVNKAILELDPRKATGIDEPSVKFLKLAAIVINIASTVYQKPSFLKPGTSQVLFQCLRQVLLQK